MKERRCYATTGERIILKFSINGYPMGSELMLSVNPEIKAEVISRRPIETVEIIKFHTGLKPPFPSIYTVKEPGEECSFTWADTNFKGDAGYYIRVILKSNDQAWSSPIWITDDKGKSIR